MSLQATIARIAGDTWRSWRLLAVWPWPAVLVGVPRVRFTWDDYRVFTRYLLPGDIILTTSEPYFLSNRGIKCTVFKHAALYTGPVSGSLNQEDKVINKPKLFDHSFEGEPPRGVHKRTVTHATSDGVICQDLGELLFHSDWACVVRPKGISNSQRFTMVDTALDQIGLGYNFDFRPTGPKSFYCTELVVHCLKTSNLALPPQIRLNVDWKGLIAPLDRFKELVIVSDAFIRDMNVVCTSVSCLDPNFPSKSHWHEEVRIKLLHSPDATSEAA